MTMRAEVPELRGLVPAYGCSGLRLFLSAFGSGFT